MNAAPMDRAHMLLARLENPSADDAELWELLHAIEVATFSRVEDRVRLVPGLDAVGRPDFSAEPQTEIARSSSPSEVTFQASLR